MAILNYTTSIAAEKTVMEIQGKLAAAKASAVMCEYEGGIITSVAFRINTPQGEHAFRLPANIDGVFAALKKSPKVPARLKTREQAAMVSWRIVKDWVEAQIAIIEADMATLSQVFLPYMQISADDTVYTAFEKRGFPMLSAPSP